MYIDSFAVIHTLPPTMIKSYSIGCRVVTCIVNTSRETMRVPIRNDGAEAIMDLLIFLIDRKTNNQNFMARGEDGSERVQRLTDI
uniref:hypothetical protein n=1 Tax=Marinobacterium profundum TaxID=1714300 RepID=UPI001315A338|nr:hypothetical protein [Marinobacterium profundum]